MFNRNNNRINRGMRHFEGFDMNRGQGRGPGQFGDFRQMNGRDRFFKKGNLQFVILEMLKEEPRHGYQIIKDLEEKFKGFYCPSPGSVYPILQMLEDRDFVTITKDGNKKVYSITEEGQQFVDENKENSDFSERMAQFENVDFEEMKQSREKLHDLFHLFMKASKESMQDNDKKEQLDKIIKETKEKLEQLSK